MGLNIRAACLSRPGQDGKSNGNNCYFNGRHLEPDNRGLRNPACFEHALQDGEFAALFDGLGPEAGKAAYAAAQALRKQEQELSGYLIPEREHLERLCRGMEEAVISASGGEADFGTAFAALYFTTHKVYLCSIGDTGVYLSRQGVFSRISPIPGAQRRSCSGAGCLGAGTAPNIAKGSPQPGDRYLICTDSIIRVMSNPELSGLLQLHTDPADCLEQLLNQARSRNPREDLAAILLEIY